MYWEYYFTIENVLVTCHIFVSILSIIRERYKNVAELIINILSYSKGGILDKFTKNNRTLLAKNQQTSSNKSGFW